MRVRGFLTLGMLCLACSSEESPARPPASVVSSAGSGGDAGSANGGAGAAGSSISAGGGGAVGGSAGAGGASGCIDVGPDAPVVVATATSTDEHLMSLTAVSASHTLWAEAGNEALILEVLGASGRIGHLVLHQGADGFAYDMALGGLASGEAVSVVVSPLSAASATPSVCVGPVTLTAAADLGDAGEGLLRAPILKWPVQKRFDDLPVLLGWSKGKQRYQAVYTSENGGTVENCGGGADGMQAEIARWGRGCDIEGLFSYGGASPAWGRCTGSTTFAAIQPSMEAEHPVLYYGDGHNRLFESRGGYGQTCGSGSAEKSDGDLAGWNTQSPGDDPSLDGDLVLTVRLAPVSLDAIGYDQHAGRREGLLDRYAPWIYRVTGSELAREGKIDGSKLLPMDNYLFVDVFAADVGGSGDPYCSFMVSSGFRLRVETRDGLTHDSTQMTDSYFGGSPDWKRLAVPLGQVYDAMDVTAFVFDAYDDDGIYWLALGDAFIAKTHGDNGALLDFAHQGETAVDVYVDDDSSNCPGGMNPDGPSPPYPCVGSDHEIAP